MSSALKGCEAAFWTWRMSVMCLWALLRRRSSAMRLQEHRAGRPWRSSKCSSQSPSPILGHLVLFCFHIWLGPTNCPKPACSHSTEALGSSHFSATKLSGNEPCHLFKVCGQGTSLSSTPRLHPAFKVLMSLWLAFSLDFLDCPVFTVILQSNTGAHQSWDTQTRFQHIPCT